MRLFQIDAFADAPFKAPWRPFACSTPQRDEKWMQDVAAEMNLSETAFVRREDGDWSLRWFSRHRRNRAVRHDAGHRARAARGGPAGRG